MLYRVAGVLETILPLSALTTVVAAGCLGGRLFDVYDLSNMSHDIRVVGALLLGLQCEDNSVGQNKHGMKRSPRFGLFCESGRGTFTIIPRLPRIAITGAL